MRCCRYPESLRLFSERQSSISHKFHAQFYMLSDVAAINLLGFVAAECFPSAWSEHNTSDLTSVNKFYFVCHAIMCFPLENTHRHRPNYNFYEWILFADFALHKNFHSALCSGSSFTLESFHKIVCLCCCDFCANTFHCSQEKYSIWNVFLFMKKMFRLIHFWYASLITRVRTQICLGLV
jgi:hypothetical protein